MLREDESGLTLMKMKKHAKAGFGRAVEPTAAKKSPHRHLAKLKIPSRDPLKLIKVAVAGRVRSLLPLREERMAESAFAFFRGAASLMAADLGRLPNTGVFCQLCGDAHLENLGAFAGLDGRLVFDINDFDETVTGPFEWDVKRLITSILLAGKAAKLTGAEAGTAAEAAIRRYCEDMQRLAKMPILQAARLQVHGLDTVAPITGVLEKAERATPLHSLEKLTEKHEEERRFRTQEPVLRRVSGSERRGVLSALREYRDSLPPERLHFLSRFRPIDVAFKVVGVGSVGMRDYCIYLQGNGPDDPLFLQMKEETNSCYRRYLPKNASPKGNQGRRVVDGQRAMQLESDPLLGWTEMDGRDYLVRQLKDHKASLDLECLTAQELADYAEITGALLARGHSRSGDAARIAECIGEGIPFQQAILNFAKGYAEQTANDWKVLTASMKTKTPSGIRKSKADKV